MTAHQKKTSVDRFVTNRHRTGSLAFEEDEIPIGQGQGAFLIRGADTNIQAPYETGALDTVPSILQNSRRIGRNRPDAAIRRITEAAIGQKMQYTTKSFECINWLTEPGVRVGIANRVRRDIRTRDRIQSVRSFGDPAMELNAQRDGDIVSVAVEGRLDSTNASQFEEAVNAEVGGSNCSLILDLENLAYISSAGLRAILLITKSIKAKGADIALCALPSQIEEVFSISGFDKIIPIHPTRQAAVDSLS